MRRWRRRSITSLIGGVYEFFTLSRMRRRKTGDVALGSIYQRVADVAAHPVECDTAQLRHATLDHAERGGKLEIRVPLEIPLLNDQTRAPWESCTRARNGISQLELLDVVSGVFDEIGDAP